MKNLNLAFLVLCFLWKAQSVCGTSSGLNNIPTADTPPDRVLVIQEINTLGPDRAPDYALGFKMGLEPFGFGREFHTKFEWGLDSQIAPDDAGPAVFQAKVAMQPWKSLPALAGGAANIAVTDDDRAQAGEAFKFLVLSQDFKVLRLHGGYGWQPHGNTPFFGIDKTFKVFGRDLMLRSDAIQIQNNSQWLASFGGIYFINKDWAFESWVSVPVERGDPSTTLKLNFAFKF